MANLLKSDDLNISCEEHIFHALMGWINYDSTNRRPNIGYLLGFVKLPLLSPAFLADQVEPAVEGKKDCTRVIVLLILSQLIFTLNYLKIMIEIQSSNS